MASRPGSRPAAGGFGREVQHDLQRHGDHALHVHRPAPVEVARVELAAERVVRPALGVGGHDIQVAQQEQGTAARAVAAQPGDDVAPAGERLQDARWHARAGQDPGQVAGGHDLVAGRVDGPQAQERLEMADQAGEPLVGHVARVDAHAAVHSATWSTATRMSGRAARSWSRYWG